MADKLVPSSEQIQRAHEQHAKNMREFREDLKQMRLAQAETAALKRRWEIENEECSLP